MTRAAGQIAGARGHRRAEPRSGPWRRPAPRTSSASPAARSCRPTTRCSTPQIRHILVRHEQGAGHAAAGLRRGHRPGRRLHGHLRPGRDQPGHADRRRPHGLGADRRDHRPGRRARRSAPTPSRRPTSAASRCRSPSTTSWSPTPPRSRAPIAEAFHIASTGRPGPVLVDIAKDALQAQTTFAWPTELDLPGYRPVTRPHAKQIREAARLIARVAPSGAVRRRRRDPGRAPPRSCARWPSSPASRSSPR